MSELSRIVRKFKGKKILAIGDIMLDTYLEGEVSRISPEAPVPVLKVSRERYVLGGVANTAVNCARMKAKVWLMGVVGDDTAGKALKDILKKKGINARNVVIDKNRTTIKKIRVVTKQQQMMRIDHEQTGNISRTVEAELASRAKELILEMDGVIISDYTKGTLTPKLIQQVIRTCSQNKIPLVIDPKPDNIKAYKGATLITPNLLEAEKMCGFPLKGEREIEQAGKKLIELTGSNILLTQGEKGMTLFERQGGQTAIPTQAKEVYDVSGAGDTVAAVMCLGMAARAELREAAIIANHAAGIVVGKLGTSSTKMEELLNVLEEESTKVKTLEEMKEIVGDLKNKGKRIVWTNGCFDILHVGHTRYLNDSRKCGDILILGLNTDASVKRLKGKGRPILPEKERAEVLSSLSSVDYIVFFGEDTPEKALKALVPDVITKGGDYTVKEVVGHKLMQRTGGEVKIVPLIEGYSTTDLIKRIRKR
ncbi:MAG: D-glycero-beta-D-manno-heptose-7-phosphate kinase [Nanoarchaeota archaeon]|nr:D-glycero-beta-D-manno-heptose-7-phosphate kinase [Nanoarchaeota archaeon]